MDGNAGQFMMDGWINYRQMDGNIGQIRVDGNFVQFMMDRNFGQFMMDRLMEILDTHLDGRTHISQFSSPAVNTIRHHTTCCDSCPDL